MIPELGNFCLMLAFSLALVQGVLPIAGSFNGNRRWMALARPTAAGQLFFIVLAFGALVYSFIANDFSVAYVEANSNSTLPLYYRIAATWGGHEGSLLLWVLMLTGWMFAVAMFSRQLPQETVARVLGIMGLIGVGLMSFMLFTSNPFDRLVPGAIDGHDLNPLLQDFGMIIHPPLLYMGYVGFSVAFSFALAALMGGQLDAAWARWSRPWTLMAWMFLTLGIFVGSFWAYYELGWGGWWFWDAVENASFMPWLVGTALIHSLAVTEKRGSFKNWTVLLAIIAFSLSLLGTFLVRSGVLTSVHAFATDPRRGLFILVFLAIVIGGALTLYAWRAPQVGLGGRFSLFSRETLLLINNVLLLVCAGTVLLGTMYPLFLDALGMGKISVGPPYFEAVFIPLMLPVLFLMAPGLFMRWKESSVKQIAARLKWVALAAVLTGVALAVALSTSVMATLGLILALWIMLATASHLLQRLGHFAAGTPVRARISSLPLSYWGMLVAHLGIAIFVIGVTLVKGLEASNDVSMHIGDTTNIGGYVVQLSSMQRVNGPNYTGTQGTFVVTKGTQTVAVLKPEKRIFTVTQMPMTDAAIDRGITRDLYISLGDAVSNSAWAVRVQVKPFVSWIWSGCIIIALGGLLAASDRRYRMALKKNRKTAAPPVGVKPFTVAE